MKLLSIIFLPILLLTINVNAGWEDYKIKEEILNGLNQESIIEINNFKLKTKNLDIAKESINNELNFLNNEVDLLNYSERFRYGYSLYLEDNTQSKYVEENINIYPHNIELQIENTIKSLMEIEEEYFKLTNNFSEILLQTPINPVTLVNNERNPTIPTIKEVVNKKVIIEIPNEVNIKQILDSVLNVFALAFLLDLEYDVTNELGFRIYDNKLEGYGLTAPWSLKEVYRRGPTRIDMRRKEVFNINGLFIKNKDLIEFLKGQTNTAGKATFSRREVVNLALNLKEKSKMGGFIILNDAKVVNSDIIKFNNITKNLDKLNSLVGIGPGINVKNFFILATWASNKYNGLNIYDISKTEDNVKGWNEILINSINSKNENEFRENPYEHINRELTEYVMEEISERWKGKRKWEFDLSLYIYY